MTPSGTNGLRVREVVDMDFGDQRRHGYERLIPTDFGMPTEVTAQSDTAPDDVDVDDMGIEARVRIGDPDVTVTGQHRYVLEYTYPNTTVSTGRIALDVIGTDETFGPTASRSSSPDTSSPTSSATSGTPVTWADASSSTTAASTER